MPRFQVMQLVQRFDTFGDNLESELLRHGDYGVDDRLVLRRVRNVAYEGLIDLELVDRQLVQVTQ